MMGEERTIRWENVHIIQQRQREYSASLSSDGYVCALIIPMQNSAALSCGSAETGGRLFCLYLTE